MPFATHVSCTIEMTSTTREWDVAVIDEIQMIGNPQRGQAWTRALLGLRAREVVVVVRRESSPPSVSSSRPRRRFVVARAVRRRFRRLVRVVGFVVSSASSFRRLVRVVVSLSRLRRWFVVSSAASFCRRVRVVVSSSSRSRRRFVRGGVGRHVAPRKDLISPPPSLPHTIEEEKEAPSAPPRSAPPPPPPRSPPTTAAHHRTTTQSRGGARATPTRCC